MPKAVKLNLFDFNRACESASFSQYIFVPENQTMDWNEHTITTRISFGFMVVSPNPNMICFKISEDSGDYLCLHGVKYIVWDNSNTKTGKVFTVVCGGDPTDNSHDCLYTVLAR